MWQRRQLLCLKAPSSCRIYLLGGQPGRDIIIQLILFSSPFSSVCRVLSGQFPLWPASLSLSSKRHFADVIKLKIFEETFLDYPDGSSVITRVLIRERGRQESLLQRELVMKDLDLECA